MNKIKLWPHLTIMAVAVAVIAGLATAFYLKHEQTVQAEELPSAARIQRVDGEVAVSDSIANAEAAAEWVAATPNQPVSVGDRIYTRDNAHTSLAFSGRNFARLDPNTSLDVVSLDNRRTQLALRDGSAIFDVGYLEPDEIFEVATPRGAVTFAEPGLYNMGFDNDGNVLVSVLSGLAQVAGLGGTGQINKGEILTLLGQTAAEVVLSRLNGDQAGSLVDNYYRSQYPAYDGRYSNYDTYLNDPFYYDPSRENVSYQYVNPLIPGIHDLATHGDWQNLDGYGYAWRPRVDEGWVPYQQGAWVNDYPYGPTWVSTEPWGYAPYHYGRWANSGNQWYWVPEPVNQTPVYAPALVAFVPVTGSNEIAWVPLAPGEAYAPHYYDNNWQPQYLTRANILPEQLVNLAIPGAVTVIPIDAFGRTVDRRSLRRADPKTWASVRPTLDPLTLTPLRNAVIHSAWGRGKIDLPPGIAKKLQDTPVFVGADPREFKFRKNLAKAMRVERVSDKGRSEKLRIKDERQAQRVEFKGEHKDVRGDAKAAKDVARDNDKQAREVAREVERQQRDAAKVQRKAEQQPQGERVRNRAKEQPQAERPQVHPRPAVIEKQQKHQDKPRGDKGGGGSPGKGKGKGKG